MGLELKRVSIDFDYPLHEVWDGYVNPYWADECDECDGTGLNETSQHHYDVEMRAFKLSKDWKEVITQEDVVELIKEDRLQEFTRVPLNDEQKKDCSSDGLLEYNNGYIPTAEEINKIAKTRTCFFTGYDVYILTKARAKRKYGVCPYCKGDGVIYDSNESKKLFEEWKETHPPTGDGYQLWSTASEGSPISPVFAALDELCEWCVDNLFEEDNITKEEWEKMLGCDGL